MLARDFRKTRQARLYGNDKFSAAFYWLKQCAEEYCAMQERGLSLGTPVGPQRRAFQARIGLACPCFFPWRWSFFPLTPPYQLWILASWCFIHVGFAFYHSLVDEAFIHELFNATVSFTPQLLR